MRSRQATSTWAEGCAIQLLTSWKICVVSCVSSPKRALTAVDHGYSVVIRRLIEQDGVEAAFVNELMVRGAVGKLWIVD